MTQVVQLTRDEYQALWDQLNQAHSVLPGSETALRQQFRDRMDAIQDALDAFDREDIQANTASFEALKAKIAEVNGDLSVLKAELETVANHISIAAKVVSAIDQAITVGAKLLP